MRADGRIWIKLLCCWALVAASAAPVLAQDGGPAAPAAGGGAKAPAKAPANTSAQIEAGEPRADTSAPNPPEGIAPAARAPAAPAPGAVPVPTARAAPATASRRAETPVSKTRLPADRVDLNTATVTGDKEQPKVMYIVPWKRPDVGDLSGKPMNSLLDEALAPVDRDEFRREVAYYDAVKADAPHNGASTPAAQVEK